MDKINEGTLAGKLKYLDDLRRQQNNKEVTLAEAKSILRHAQDLKCNSNAKSRANFAANARLSKTMNAILGQPATKLSARSDQALER